jgi:CheY-like chemotaxis protein
MSQILVLSVSSDPVVLGTRDQLLRSAGYIVVTAISIKEAVHLFQDGDFDIIILCHSLPTNDCEHLKSFIRASGSRIPIVRASGAAPGEQAAFADATLDKDPVAFLRTLEDVICKNPAMQPAGASVR